MTYVFLGLGKCLWGFVFHHFGDSPQSPQQHTRIIRADCEDFVFKLHLRLLYHTLDQAQVYSNKYQINLRTEPISKHERARATKPNIPEKSLE